MGAIIMYIIFTLFYVFSAIFSYIPLSYFSLNFNFCGLFMFDLCSTGVLYFYRALDMHNLKLNP